jgi:hypothetical protein
MRYRLVATLACLVAAACSKPIGWITIDPATLSPAQQAQRARADQARNELATALLTELQAAIAKDGAAAAIDVCRLRAPAIAKDIAARTGVQLGRTSVKLRNPDNVTPVWATAHVVGTGTEAATFVVEDGRLGSLAPIRLMPLCVQCHGQRDDLATDVRAALNRLYPADQATGFAPGDLRGWFWVEVPAGS